MSLTVNSAAAPRTLARQKRKRSVPASAAPAAPHRRANAAAPAAPAAAKPAAAAAQAAKGGAESAKPAAPVKSPEYDAAPFADTVGGIVGSPYGGVVNDLAGPHVGEAVGKVLTKERIPFLATPYGAVIPGKVAGTITGEIGNAVGSILTDALKGSKGEPGLGYEPTPANKLIAGTTKGIVTSWIKLALTDALKPAPQPKPIYPADVKPIGVEQPPAPPAPKPVLHTDTAKIAGTIRDRLIGAGIGAVYDQVVGPLVLRMANLVTGRAGEEVAAPKPLTPGKVVNGITDAVLSSMLIPNLEYAPLPGPPGSPVPQPGPTPFAATLGTSILNNVIGAAWGTVYGRGLGPAIENGVNDLAGIRSKDDKQKAVLPAFEHFTRAATRGVAVGATTYLIGSALQKTMAALGAQMGGVGGALVAMAGAALIGSVGGSVVDATIGPMLGKLGGQIYTFVTGKPNYEQRAADAAKKPTPDNPGPTPGDPVKAPNGNPGTVPAPDAPKAPAAPAPAPAAGAPRKRRRTGNAAVDRTSPAIDVPNSRLVAIAARG